MKLKTIEIRNMMGDIGEKIAHLYTLDAQLIVDLEVGFKLRALRLLEAVDTAVYLSFVREIIINDISRIKN